MSEMADLIAEGRTQAEALMLDTCTIKRPSDETTIDPDTGLPTTTWASVYSGKCKIQSENVEALVVNSGDHAYTVDRLTVHVPVTASGIRVGDTIEITDSAMDPANVERKFRVTGLSRKTLATAQRLSVEEVVA